MHRAIHGDEDEKMATKCGQMITQSSFSLPATKLPVSRQKSISLSR
jgi:hypothetical protein